MGTSASLFGIRYKVARVISLSGVHGAVWFLGKVHWFDQHHIRMRTRWCEGSGTAGAGQNTKCSPPHLKTILIRMTNLMTTHPIKYIDTEATFAVHVWG